MPGIWCPGPASSRPRRLFARASGGGVFFAASTPETGEELWYCSAYHARDEFSARIIDDILPGPLGSEPFPIAVLENVVYFYASTLQTGRELWCTNSNEKRTAMIADLAPGTGESMPMSPKVLQCRRGLVRDRLRGSESTPMLCRYDFATQTGCAR